MTAHLHASFVDGCYRCELALDEGDTIETFADPVWDDPEDVAEAWSKHLDEGP